MSNECKIIKNQCSSKNPLTSFICWKYLFFDGSWIKSEININPHLDPKFTGNWIKFLDIIAHPKHIRNHDMWTDISSEVSDKLRGDDYIVDVNNIKVIDWRM